MTQDRELQENMNRLLEIAKALFPESVICLITFTAADADPSMSINKIVCNVAHREALEENVSRVMHAFVAAPVVDLTDVVGGMQ